MADAIPEPSDRCGAMTRGLLAGRARGELRAEPVTGCQCHSGVMEQGELPHRLSFHAGRMEDRALRGERGVSGGSIPVAGSCGVAE